MNVFTAAQMREFDRAAIEDYGIPGIVLMENAALRVVEFLEAKFSPLSEKRIVVLCGKGNNGGDGLAIARHLMSSGRPLTILHPDPATLSGDALTQWRILKDRDGRGEIVHWINWSQLDLNNMKYNGDYHSLVERAIDANIIVDALLGTGVSEPLREPYNQLISAVLSGLAYILSVDVPSGINANTGEDLQRDGIRTNANATVTFAAPKRGLFLKDGLIASGEVWIGGIGTRLSQVPAAKTGAKTIDRKTAWRLSAMHLRRSINAHKGDAGRVLICGGSFGMSGAPALASRAALRVGAGLVAAALPERVLPIFAAQTSEPTSHALTCDAEGFLLESAVDELAQLWAPMQVVALGPGLGRTEGAFAFARRVVRECPVPLLVDADALHALPDIAGDVAAREAPTILTPHPGEMGVLLGKSTQDVEADRFASVAECAQKYNAVTVLKGARTLVAFPDGDTFVNLTGNPGMATGGSGDALTGTIAGLLAQTKDARTATLLGVYLHGLAGDLAFQTRGNGLIAGDIVEHLPIALLELDKPGTPPINARLRKLE